MADGGRRIALPLQKSGGDGSCIMMQTPQHARLMTATADVDVSLIPSVRPARQVARFARGRAAPSMDGNAYSTRTMRTMRLPQGQPFERQFYRPGGFAGSAATGSTPPCQRGAAFRVLQSGLVDRNEDVSPACHNVVGDFDLATQRADASTPGNRAGDTSMTLTHVATHTVDCDPHFHPRRTLYPKRP
jgi:hypothetical protein